VEYQVRVLAYPPKITSAILYLLKISPNNATTNTELRRTTNDENLYPGRIIPDGQGGVLATWSVVPSVFPDPAPEPLPRRYQAVHVVADALPLAGPYDLPFRPVTARVTYGVSPSLVLGENGVMFASGYTTSSDGLSTDLAQIMAMNLDTGTPIWSYEVPAQNTIHRRSRPRFSTC
jgi:outer membrane protein assembly factor BamB